MIVARIERLEAADIRDTDTTFPAASATCRGGSCALPGKADYCFGRKAGVRLGRPPEDLADPGAVVARSESGPRYLMFGVELPASTDDDDKVPQAVISEVLSEIDYYLDRGRWPRSVVVRPVPLWDSRDPLLERPLELLRAVWHQNL
jgi:hypothetical protein